MVLGENLDDLVVEEGSEIEALAHILEELGYILEELASPFFIPWPWISRIPLG